MREHRYSLDLPHTAARLWALMQDYDRWADYAPRVVRLEPLAPQRTRLHFEERYHLTAWPWRWFEGPIYRFINRKNEESMQRLSDWLSANPEYRSDLAGNR